jgi:hypothetical protein
MIVKTVALAPMPSASVRIAKKLKPGVLRIARTAYRKSRTKSEGKFPVPVTPSTNGSRFGVRSTNRKPAESKSSSRNSLRAASYAPRSSAPPDRSS